MKVVKEFLHTNFELGFAALNSIAVVEWISVEWLDVENNTEFDAKRRGIVYATGTLRTPSVEDWSRVDWQRNNVRLSIQVRRLDSFAPGASLKKNSPRGIFLPLGLLSLIPSFFGANYHIRRVLQDSSPRICFLGAWSLRNSSRLFRLLPFRGLGFVKPPSR